MNTVTVARSSHINSEFVSLKHSGTILAAMHTSMKRS